MVLTRQEFQHWVEKRFPHMAGYHSAIWSVETKKISRWFVLTKPVSMQRDGRRLKDQYWNWCNAHCAGQLLCYYSDFDNQEEWWGFSDKQDIALWLLKWT